MSTGQPIEIHVDPETGCALARLAAPSPNAGPGEIDLTTLVSACRDAGIAICEDTRKCISDLFEQFRDDPREIERIVARPVEPIDGEDGFIEWCEGYDPALRIKSIDKDGRVDHYAVRTFVRVDEAAHVGTLHAPTPGTDGRDVFGKPIPATPGKSCALSIDPTLAVGDDGCIVTQRQGVLTVEDETVAVNKLLEVSEHVDFSTGHIDFDGCVDIREDVRDLFQIRASGSVSIGGLIEAATITCGGNFIGHRGMIGRGRGSLTVTGDAEIGFLNTISGSFGGTLTVRREIIDCRLVVESGLNAKQCTMIGGTLELRGRGVIGTIGSPSDRPTHVTLTAEANLLVPKMIHSKVTFQIGDRVYQVNRQTKGPVRIVADGKYALAYRVADGVPRPLEEISTALAAAA